MYSTILSKGTGAFCQEEWFKNTSLPTYTQCKTLPTSLLTTWPPHTGLHHFNSPLFYSQYETFQLFLTNQCTFSLKCGKILTVTFTQKIPRLFVLQLLASTCLLFVLGQINNTFILFTNIMVCLLNMSAHKLSTDHYGSNVISTKAIQKKKAHILCIVQFSVRFMSLQAIKC